MSGQANVRLPINLKATVKSGYCPVELLSNRATVLFG